jgi:hypothetical protein
MQLVHNPSQDTLGRAARLTGLSEQELRNDRAANVRGAAAVLSDIVDERPGSLNGWQEALAEYGGTQLYAVEVYETLETGATLTISTGERLVLTSQKDAGVPRVPATRSGGADYGRAVWRPAHYGNYTDANRGPGMVEEIVLHVAQGSYPGTVSWFQDPAANASAHYVVSPKGRVAQCVRDEDIAWHAGWWPTNRRSIGIEHAGYIGNPRWFTDAMYHSSARLAASLARRLGIPVDREHIIGHNRVPGCPGTGGGVRCHTDPGRYWDWDRYLRLIRRYR